MENDNDLTATLTQALQDIKKETGEDFYLETVNLAELQRRTGISRAKLRRLKGKRKFNLRIRFSQMHNIQPEALRSWIHEKMERAKLGLPENTEVFQASEFVELDIPGASKHRIAVGIDRKELITVRAGGIEIYLVIISWNLRTL